MTDSPQIISGAIHYARVHPQQWRHRLQMLLAMGADTVETYVPWNLHEPRPGEYRFDGGADLGGFLDLADELGLRAIVRPGPYICAEWDNGGLPWWLTADRSLALRTRDPRYVAAVERWFDVLIPQVASRLVTRGGPVTLVQVENEYGSYGSDLEHLEQVRAMLVARGVDVPLFTSDGPEDHMLTGGTIPGVWATVNFGSGATEAFATLARHRPDDAPFCMEFWNGWFDHWGGPHHVRPAADAAASLAEILDAGASVNVYMAHGGTSFGTTAGANHHGSYTPTITSYDYDAPIDEAGRATEKFWAYREVIARRRPVTVEPPAPSPVLPQARVELAPAASVTQLLDAGESRTTGHPPTFEELGIEHGLVRYRTRIRGPRQAYDLTLPGLADRAHVYAGGRLLGVAERGEDWSAALEVPADGLELELLVESMGRVNYGPWLGERKGLVDGVLHERQHLHGWESTGLALQEQPQLPADHDAVGADVSPPALYRGTFEAAGPADSFLALPGWGKGYVWVNGFNLGRYWDRGPQATLYLPAPVVQEGVNEIVVLELDRVPGDVAIELRDQPDLGPELIT